MPTEQSILFQAGGMIESAVKEEFAKQGHHLTGAWEQSLTSTMLEPNHIEGVAKGYGGIVNAGVTPGRIPFSGTVRDFGGSGALSAGATNLMNYESAGGSTGKSAYIQGLVRFWLLRKPGITEKEALSLAFATAKVQKREGLSTINSRSFSSTGQRQLFIQGVWGQISTKVNDFVLSGLNQIVLETRDKIKNNVV